MPTIPLPSWIRRLAGPAALALLYCAGARLAFLLASASTHLAPFCPPTGLALGGLLIFGWRAWPGVWLGAFAANCEFFYQVQGWISSSILWLSAATAFGNTLEALAGWYLCTRWLGLKGEAAPGVASQMELGKVSEFGFVAVALSVSLIAVTVGTVVMCAIGYATWPASLLSLLIWWSSDATGILYFTPFLLVWMAAPPFFRSMRLRSETAVAFTVLVLCCAMIFLWNDRGGQVQNFKFIVMGPMVWIATRSGLRATTAGLVVLGIFAAVGLQRHIDHHAQQTDWKEVFALQAFLWVVGFTSLTLTRRVAAHHRAQATIAEADHALEAIMEAIPALVWVAHDPDCHRITGNPAAQKLIEMPVDANVTATPPEPRELPFVMCRDGNPLPTDQLPMQLAIATRKPVMGVELGVNLASGRVVDLYGNAVPLFDGRGAVKGCVAVFMDITGRKESELALRESEGRFRTLARLAPVGIFRSDTNGAAIYVNEKWCAMAGLTQEQCMVRGWLRAVHPNDRPQVEAVWDVARVGGASPDAEFRFVKPDGAVVWVQGSVISLHDSRGILTGYVGSVVDITRIKRAEEALREKEAELRLIANLTPIMLVRCSRDMRYVFVNRPYALRFGLMPDQVIGKLIPEVVGEDAFKAILPHIETVLSGEPVEYEVEIPYEKIGSHFMHVTYVPERDVHGDVIGLIGAISDISARKRTEAALREADQKLRLHFEQSPMGAIEWNLDFRVTRWNPAAQIIFGYSREEAVGQHASFIIPYAFRDHVDQIWQALMSKSGGERSTNENVRQDGGTILCEWFNTPLIDERGTFTGAASLVQDITARKELEEVLASTADLLERTGEMAKVGGWELDLASMKHTWSLATCRILEVDPPEAPPVDQGINFYVPEARPIIRAAVQAAIEHGTPYDLELQVITAKGRAIWVRAQGHAELENGKTIKLVGALHDVTERRQAEQLLGWEKSALELINSAASLPDVLHGLTLGLEEQLPGSLCSVLLLDADGVHLRHGAAPNLPEAYNRAIDGGAIGPTVGSCGTAAFLGRQIIVADIGSDPLWADYRELALGHGLRACFSTPILTNEAKVLGTFAIYYPEPRHPLPDELTLVARAVHVTRIAIERKQAEAALRESETKYRTLFDLAGDAIFLMEGALFIDCNARALEMFGCVSRDQIVGQPPYRFSPPFQPSGKDSREAALEKISSALGGQLQTFEWMHIRLDGTPFPAVVSLSAVELGGRVLLQGIVHDITDRRNAEQALQRLNEELELRVASRTSALLQTNDELNREIVERRRLEKDLVTISEREQRRLGEDLHERLGSQLAGMGFLCQVLAGRLQAEVHPQAGAAADLNVLLQESLDAARKIAHSSYPVELDTGGLFVAVQGLAARTSQIYGVQCELRCKRRQFLHHDGEVAIHLYRIIQEAVTNAIRHGQATSIVIECRENHGVQTIAITNNGAAFAENGRSEGMGLHLMRHRARLVGAEIELRQPEGGGFEVLCRFKAA